MSGFSSDWLDLRAPYDRAARNGSLIEDLADLTSACQSLRILDLGAGTGATLRALAKPLHCDQHWILLDSDADLLRRAKVKSKSWAEQQSWPFKDEGSVLTILAKDRRIVIETKLVDLLEELEALPFAQADLITSSALLDLASEAWLERLLGSTRGCLHYHALVADGRLSFTPQEDLDETVFKAFRDDLASHKSFGLALGGCAPGKTLEHAEEKGFTCRQGESDWLAEGKDAALQSQLLESYKAVAAKRKALPEAQLQAWYEQRQAAISEKKSHHRVGHQDLLLRPKAD